MMSDPMISLRGVRNAGALPRRRLPLQVRPMAAETLRSYLGRVEGANYLPPNLVYSQSRAPDSLAVLSALTGYSERHLVSALPELRQREALTIWPHLVGEVSARAGTRPACTSCVAARLGINERVVVFAAHEQVLCPSHHRWLGNDWIQCAREGQFSLAECPEIEDAHRKHRILIKRWRRGPVRASFFDAVTCLSKWSRWPATVRAEDIRRRWMQLGITEEDPPLSPREVAAWYPNAVSLTEVILYLRQQARAVGRMTQEIWAEAIALLQREVLPGLAPSGASDPFRYAIIDNREEPDSEVESIAAPNLPD